MFWGIFGFANGFMFGFGRKMTQTHEEPVTGQNWAWGTQTDNFHVCSKLVTNIHVLSWSLIFSDQICVGYQYIYFIGTKLVSDINECLSSMQRAQLIYSNWLPSGLKFLLQLLFSYNICIKLHSWQSYIFLPLTKQF